MINLLQTNFFLALLFLDLVLDLVLLLRQLLVVLLRPFNVADPVPGDVDVVGLAIVEVLDSEAPSASGAGDNTRVYVVAFMPVAHCKHHKNTKNTNAL